MYTRPVLATFSRSGITYCSHTSFDSRLSDRKKPFASDISVTSFQNSWSLRRSGSVAVVATDAAAGGVGVDAGAGCGAGAAAAGVCAAGALWAAHEIGPAATRTPSKTAHANRFSIFKS